MPVCSVRLAVVMPTRHHSNLAKSAIGSILPQLPYGSTIVISDSTRELHKNTLRARSILFRRPQRLLSPGRAILRERSCSQPFRPGLPSGCGNGSVRNRCGRDSFASEMRKKPLSSPSHQACALCAPTLHCSPWRRRPHCLSRTCRRVSRTSKNE